MFIIIHSIIKIPIKVNNRKDFLTMKTAVIYFSKHHGNTKKVLDYICRGNDIKLINAAEIKSENLEEYDLVGFASGIYYSKFHKSVIKFAEENLPENKKVFFIFTYGALKEGYTKSIREAVSKKSADILGEFGCYGFDTFGPFKLIGGIAKGHPDRFDYENAANFFNEIKNE